MDHLARLVGERLRAARRERGLSVGGLAAVAGVGKGSLSEIENGTRNPTLSTLYSLANALEVPLATLLADHAGATVASPGIEARLLDVSHDGDHVVEVYRLRLLPGTTHRSAAHGPGVIEHLLVTAGRARVGRAGAEREIGPGESAAWVSDAPHAYAALGSSPVESVLVIRSPAERVSGLGFAHRGPVGLVGGPVGWGGGEVGVQGHPDVPGAGGGSQR